MCTFKLPQGIWQCSLQCRRFPWARVVFIVRDRVDCGRAYYSSRSSRFAAMLDEGARAERGLEARKSERGEGVGERVSKLGIATSLL